MFQMMNYARAGVGMGARPSRRWPTTPRSGYARERRLGRPINGDPAPPVPIIEHADIRRMLLLQRAIAEGSLSLIVYCSKLLDLHRAGPEEDRARNALLLDFLTPVAKSYPSEMGILSVSAGLQCLGGYGYCDEFPLEQYYRDIRIHSIHEGTTGIQGIDLLGRKVTMREGAAFNAFVEEVGRAIEAARGIEPLRNKVALLTAALKQYQDVTRSLVDLGREGQTDVFLADATLYLEYSGILAMAWQWLLQATAAENALADFENDADRDFYLGKRVTCQYFFRYELPKTAGLATRLMQADGLTRGWTPAGSTMNAASAQRRSSP